MNKRSFNIQQYEWHHKLLSKLTGEKFSFKVCWESCQMESEESTAPFKCLPTVTEIFRLFL